MTGLNAQALAQMRQQLSTILPDICMIERMTLIPDGAGSWSENWVLVSGGTVACRLDPIYQRDQIETVAHQEAMVSEYLLTVPFDAPIEVSSRVVINGVAYQVRNLMNDHSWRVARRAYVTRVE